MKKSLLITAVLGLGAFAHAQNTMPDESWRKNEVWIAFGGTTPVGDFASTVLTNEDAGFALNGGNLALYYQHDFTDYFGLIAVLQGTTNMIDADAFSRQLELNYTGDWTTDEARYYLGGLRGGVVFNVPYRRVKFEVRGMLGFNNAVFPEVNSTSGPFYVNIESASTTSFVYSVGGGLKIYLGQSRRLFIPIHIDYLGTTATWKGVDQTTTFTSQEVDITRPMNNVNGNIGFGFSF